MKNIKWKKYDFWKRIRDYSSKKMRDAWFIDGNCDSCCPNCKQWESSGNYIKTEPFDDYVIRSCTNCDNQWKAIFTPAGFLSIEEANQ